MTDTPPPSPATPNALDALPDPAIEAPDPAAATPARSVRLRTATIIILVLAALVLVLHFSDLPIPADPNTGIAVNIAEFVIGLALFVGALVLRSRTKRAGLRRGLANAAVIVSSVLFCVLLITAIFVLGAFLILSVAFFGV